ncbi:conserved hypothetical protein [Pseudomonas sp. PM2]|jgi:hypothetical protein|uniref:hypothetical protein n=1 Tax=Pseudomonas TaxID=286 RepID=UPI000700D07E|nr:MULTISPECIES: hypothetical protein [Pseudomonas]KAA6195590.1 hypothetical protein F3K52_09190 [Pseudomonas lactis]KRD03307.1 hypothetical protein ASE33_00170 [Pseudomonas sp. Root9]
MSNKYQAAFVIPVGANKTLGEDGWEFESSERISRDLEAYFARTLELDFVKEYSGIKEYAGSRFKMLIIFDDEKNIENIFFQVFSEGLSVLSEACLDKKNFSKAELFIPC